jgi:hypothetical protein
VDEQIGAPPLKSIARTYPPVQAYSVKTVIQREGLGAIPLSLDFEGTGNVADKGGGSCRANSDCDDCDFCTTDVCTVVPPAVLGTCSNAPTSACSSCPDGDFCNGAEICDPNGTPGANCRQAAPGLPCNTPGQVCDPLGGPQMLGSCVDECTVDGDCLDTIGCNGTEACIAGPYGNVCRALNLPCGPATACHEKFCSARGPTGPPLGSPCTTNNQCGSPGGVCTIPPTCNVNGRCCTGGDNLTCTRSPRTTCAGVWLYVGDDPGTDGDQASCTLPAPPTATNAGETFNCPHYAAGIFTDVDISSLIPVGQIGAAACNDFTEIGDDYELDIADGEYLEVTTVRMIKGFQQDGIPGSASRVRITFYDEDGNFVEDTITNGEGLGAQGIRTYIYAEKPRIPKRGFIAVRAAVRFSPFGKHSWSGGVTSDTAGANDPAIMWMNGAARGRRRLERHWRESGHPRSPGVRNRRQCRCQSQWCVLRFRLG